MILDRDIYPRIKLNSVEYLKTTSKASLDVIGYINKFMPGLGQCFVDFILDTKGHPYFLHLGGFDNRLLSGMNGNDLFKSFYKNLLYLADYNKSEQKGD